MPIEVSYHTEEAIAATVEFISEESWIAEIKHVLTAIADVASEVPATKNSSHVPDYAQESYAKVRRTRCASEAC